MMTSKVAITGCSLLISILVTTVGYPQTQHDKKRLPLLLATDQDEIDIPTIDFFQAVTATLQQDSQWHMVPRAEVLQHLHQRDSFPLVSRKELSKNASDLIPTVQRLTDTIAVEAALIVDCRTMGSPVQIKSCQLHYYDAGKSKVTANVKKEFKVAVFDATLWAPRLLYKLREGLAIHQQQKVQAQLRQALSRTAQKPRDYKVMIQTNGFGEQSASRDTGLHSMAGFGLNLGLDSEHRYAGVMYEQGRASGTSRGRRTIVARESYGIIFGVASPAMTSMLWDFGISGGYGKRRTESQTEVLTVQNQPFVGIQPGLFWLIHESVGCGLYVSYREYFGGNTSRSRHAAKLGNHVWGTGIGIRARF